MGEILWRWRVLLDTFQVLDCQESLFALLVDDGGQLVILMLNLLDDLLFNALLLHDSVLHGATLLECGLGLVEQLLELADLEGTCLLEGHTATAAAMIVEVAVIAKGLVVDATVSGKSIIVLTHSNLRLWDAWLSGGLLLCRLLLSLGRSLVRCGGCGFHHLSK